MLKFLDSSNHLYMLSMLMIQCLQYINLEDKISLTMFLQGNTYHHNNVFKFLNQIQLHKSNQRHNYHQWHLQLHQDSTDLGYIRCTPSLNKHLYMVGTVQKCKNQELRFRLSSIDLMDKYHHQLKLLLQKVLYKDRQDLELTLHHCNNILSYKHLIGLGCS